MIAGLLPLAGAAVGAAAMYPFDMLLRLRSS
jgi:hypothetical protein